MTRWWRRFTLSVSTRAGLMRERHASINDLPIADSDRLFRWPLGRRPDHHPGLSTLGL